MFNIKEEVKKLPDLPGVYIMYNDKDEIIYVGKAKILKNRVRQYFQNNANHSPKVKAMVKHVDHFDYFVTSNEMEALLFENSLIKRYTPKYNIQLKDDKTYPYIKVTTNERFPKVVVTREHLDDNARYFGPFTSSMNVKENLNLIEKLWKLRSCQKVFPRDLNKERPCLNYHIGKCKAPCNMLISEEDYNEMVKEVIAFLSGKTEKIIANLEAKMYECSEKMEYENAVVYRDTINSIQILNQRQVIENSHISDRDVIALAKGELDSVVQILFVRGGRISGSEHILIEDCAGLEKTEIMTDFVKQFYSGTPYIPNEVILQYQIEDMELIQQFLSDKKKKKVSIIIPRKGEKKQLVDMAKNNAQIALDKFSDRIKTQHNLTQGALNEIKEVLGINYSLKRIESYDISHIAGFESVGAMVVYENGIPKRSDYRKFRIQSVNGPDDYASMYEIITRRFERFKEERSKDGEKTSFGKMPDMLFLDGGKGQISAVKRALENLRLYVPICGMVKDDHHRTRALLYNDKEVELPRNSAGFRLVTRIQDEVHRFAIDYHRKLHNKSQVYSILDGIEGIGEKRRRALLQKFGDIEHIKMAEIDELVETDGISTVMAQTIYDFFRK